MKIRVLTERWWRPFVFSLSFLLLGACFLGYPGLEDDEALFGNPIFHVPGSSLYDITVFHRKIPIMILSYLGTVKSGLYWLLFVFFNPSYLTVRLPVLILGAITVALFYKLLEAIHSRRAAWAGTLLLVTNTIFLLTICFDWGPVAIQHLLLVLGLLSLLRWWRVRKWWWLFASLFCMGLALWDKALFLWMLGGLTVATLAVFPRELFRLLRIRNILVAAAAFCLGALPLIKYNFHPETRFATFRSNASFVFDQFPIKFYILRLTFDGGGLLSYLVNDPWVGHAREARTPVERVSYGLESLAGQHRTNHIEIVFCLAVLLLPLLWRTPARKPMLFCLIAGMVTWLQMAITQNAGGGSHHAILLAPLVFLFLGVAFAEASQRLKKAGLPILAVVMAFLGVGGLLVTNQNLYQLARYGAAGNWSDAGFALSAELDRLAPQQIVIEDWGIMNGLVLLHRGRLPIVSVSEDFDWPRLDAGQRDYYRGLLERGLWVGHTTAYREFKGIHNKVLESAAQAGFRSEPAGTVYDSHGNAVFTLNRFVAAPAP